MKDSDSILRVRPEFDLAREFQLAQPELTRILRHTNELHTALKVIASPDLGLGRVMEEWRRTARELAALPLAAREIAPQVKTIFEAPAILAGEYARLFGGLRDAVEAAKSQFALHMESHRTVVSALQAANQQWGQQFASISVLLTEAAKVNFVLPEQALLHWSGKMVAVRAPLLEDCIRNTAALEVLHSAAIVPQAAVFPEHLAVAGQFVFDHAEVVRRLPPRLPEPQQGEKAWEDGQQHRREEIGAKLEHALDELDARFVDLRRQAWRNVSGGIAGARLAMAGIREIFTDILHALSPDAEIQKTALWQNRDPKIKSV